MAADNESAKRPLVEGLEGVHLVMYHCRQAAEPLRIAAHERAKAPLCAEYVRNIIETWAKGLGLDPSTSFKDALIKSEMLKRGQAAGREVVQGIAQIVGEKIQEAIKKV